jgi:hypothetical protein
MARVPLQLTRVKNLGRRNRGITIIPVVILSSWLFGIIFIFVFDKAMLKN